MTPEKIMLVRSSWQQVLPIKEAAAKLFYDQLFELDPSLRSMFKGDMVEQGRKLMTIINTAVNSLDDLSPILERSRRWAAPCRLWRNGSALRHGGQRADLDPGKGLGEQFTPAVRDAWVETYTTLASAMKQAAYAPA